MSGLHAELRCIGECDERYSLDEVVYRCRRCGNLLEVVHDEGALARDSAEVWKKRFEERVRTTRYPYGSGVWAKKEWVLPGIDDADVVSLFEGNTSLLHCPRYGQQFGVPDLWVKLCGNSHTGSFKDLGMTVLVSQVQRMRRKGVPLKAVACASTGDTSAALAAYAAAAGIPAIVFLPENKISLAQLVQPLSNGALVLSLRTDFDGCMALVQRITEQQDLYLANSMNSLRVEGQKSISVEIVQQLDWEPPDWVIIPGGNLGNVSALGKGFLLMEKLGLLKRRPRIVVAQAAHANPLYRAYQTGWDRFQPIPAEKTLASAIQIGNPVSVQKAIRILQQFEGVVEQATEQELSDASARADRAGLFVCPQTGVALAVFEKLASCGIIRARERTVVISTAHGLKFTEFKVGYHQGALEGVVPAEANRPVSLAPELGAVRDAINRHIETRP